MIRREGYVIWPTYFDKALTWREGRRVPASLSVRSPTADKIVEAARRLGWQAHAEEGAHPKHWWRKTGKVIVKPRQQIKKQIVVKKLAETLVRLEQMSKK